MVAVIFFIPNDQYHPATEVLRRPRALDAARPTVSEQEYKRMRGYVDQVRLKLDQARIELQTHWKDHGCSDSSN